MSAKAILFDLDGTLVDSVPDLAASVDTLMRALGRAEHGTDRVRNWVGNGVERLIDRALTGDVDGVASASERRTALSEFLPIYHANNGKHARLFPGVQSFLERCAANRLAAGVVTNKPAAFTEPLLETLGIAHHFQVVVSGDTVANKKPHPEPLLYALDALGCPPVDAWFIGDSIHDVQAGEAAGIPVVCVSYGYNHGVDIRTVHNGRVVDSLTELSAELDRA
ncbi:MAG: phosphoglycolate phosphatase [Pseudomonadota bacterium]